MKVSLVSYTQPPPGHHLSFDEYNLSHMVAYCARVSNPDNQENTETVDKLIDYLIKYKHWSPFEMTNVCLYIETTRDISRQILRHRSFSFQEFSQRYSDKIYFSGYREARLQDKKNRQNSIETKNTSLHVDWHEKQRQVKKLAEETYEWAIRNGIAKEQARVVLPEGLTVSKLYVNGTLRSWIHYIQLRRENGTQKEHREIAIACAAVIKDIFSVDI